MDSYTNGSYGDTWYMACLPQAGTLYFVQY